MTEAGLTASEARLVEKHGLRKRAESAEADAKRLADALRGTARKETANGTLCWCQQSDVGPDRRCLAATEALRLHQEVPGD